MDDQAKNREQLLAEVQGLRQRLAELGQGEAAPRAAGQKGLEDLRQAQKLEAVGRLAGGIAHNFNNLLTIVIGYSQMLQEATRPGDGWHEPLAAIHQAGERAAVLTRQLLAFSRRQLLQPVLLDLNGLIRNLEPALRGLLGPRVALELACETGLRSVRADPAQVEQVLVNLAVNARDAMPQGGRLTLETANVEGDPSGPQVRLTVRDTGQGIAEAVRPHLFEPFFTTKGVGQGSGLGLAAVHGIVGQSGGRVEVHSEVDRGTAFVIHLPAVGGPPPRPASPGGETVLLVETEDGVRALTRLVLQTSGYHVLEARDGDEALALAAGHAAPVPLLVTGVVMPCMSGTQLAERLRPLRPEMRVLYLSGYPDAALGRHGAAVLETPFSPAALVRKVRELLDR
jgi:CheY-like chemotaxis protein